jgi:dolichol-phosphate mannosyltransferase
MKLSIVVPCFNELENVPLLQNELIPVVEELLGQVWNNEPEGIQSAEILFVDDGSTDDTFLSLKTIFNDDTRGGVTYKFLQHGRNRGLGAAIRTGFSNATGDLILTIDSDGTYKFSTIPALLSLLKPDIDLVTASPYHPDGKVIGVPAYRLFLSRGSSFLYRLLLDWNVHTYTCLYRVCRSKVIKSIQFNSDGFLAVTEILVDAMVKGFRVAEYPAILYKRQYGVSKARIAQTIFSHLYFQGKVLIYRIKIFLGMKSLITP